MKLALVVAATAVLLVSPISAQGIDTSDKHCRPDMPDVTAPSLRDYCPNENTNECYNRWRHDYNDAQDYNAAARRCRAAYKPLPNKPPPIKSLPGANQSEDKPAEQDVPSISTPKVSPLKKALDSARTKSSDSAANQQKEFDRLKEGSLATMSRELKAERQQLEREQREQEASKDRESEKLKAEMPPIALASRCTLSRSYEYADYCLNKYCKDNVQFGRVDVASCRWGPQLSRMNASFNQEIEAFGYACANILMYLRYDIRDKGCSDLLR